MGVLVYVKDISPDAVTAWIAPLVGGVVLDLRDDAIRYLKATGDANTKIVIIPEMEDPEFLSLNVGGPVAPWTKSEQLAIPCCEELGKTVRWCDEETNKFMEKQPGKPPKFIDWDS